jgi:hypothetical protein
MFAGADCISAGSTPAKPPWSEVMIFFDLSLRHSNIAVTRAQQKKSPPSK